METSREETTVKAKHKWQPCIFLQVEPGESTIRTVFTPAPAEFNISHYSIALDSDSSGGTQVMKVINSTSYNFTEVKPHEYFVLITPYKCMACKRTYTKNFDVNKTNHSIYRIRGEYCNDSISMPFKDKAKNQSIRANNISDNNISPILILISVIMFAALLSLISWCIVRYRRNNIYRKTTVLHKDSQPEPKEKNKMKVYVINTFDHEHHHKACESFMVYLQEHCFCEVLNLNEYNKETTCLADTLKSVNFIILIHSEGYYKQVNAWKEKILYPELCKSNPSLLLQIMDDTVTNCIDCAMNYTNPNYLKPKNKSKQPFIIPDNMTELVCYIHNIKLDTTDEENIPLIEEHIYSSDDGLAMVNAIERATEYELLRDDWFLRLHPHSFTI